MSAPEKRRRADRVLRRWAPGTIVLLSLAAGFYFANRSGNDPSRYSNDFNVYYFASHEVLEGRDPYQRSLGDSTRYLYLPLLSELMIPLALLPLPIAAYIWFLIGAASVIATAGMSASMAGETSSTRSRWLHTLVFLLAPLFVVRFALDNFDLGQVNPLVGALAVAHIILYERDRKLWSAATLVVAVSIKLTPAVLIAYHLARRRFKYAAVCFALFASVTALSFAPFGSQASSAFQTFFSRTLRNEQGFDLSYSGNQSLRGVIARLRGGEESAQNPSEPLTIGLSLAMLGLAIVTTVLARSTTGAAASLFCCIALLSPLAWKAHFIFFLFPAAFVISEVASNWRTKRSYAAGAALILAFSLFNLTSPKLTGLATAEWVDSHSLIFAGGVLVFAATLLCALDRNAMTSKFGFVTLLKTAEKSE